MAFVDFGALKSAVSIEQVVDMLGLEMKASGSQLRGICPACKTTGGRELVVTPSKGAFYCFADKKGGDLIALVSHIEGIPVKDAAVFIADQAGMGTGTSSTVQGTGTSTAKIVPAPKPEPQAPQEDKLERVAARLLHEHEAVQALGLSPEVAESLGIGYDGRGLLRGRVVFPLYKDGELAGFMGFAAGLQPVLKFPDNISKQTNVIPLKKAG